MEMLHDSALLYKFTFDIDSDKLSVMILCEHIRSNQIKQTIL